MVPRVQPPQVDLAALRDLANRTARLAIERHTSRIWLQAVLGKWFFATISVIVTGGLLYWMRTRLVVVSDWSGRSVSCDAGLVVSSHLADATHRPDSVGRKTLEQGRPEICLGLSQDRMGRARAADSPA